MQVGGVLGEVVARRTVVDVGVPCLLYTSDAADERSSVDLGGRRILKKNNHIRRRRDELI